MSAAELLLRPEPAQRPEVAVRAEHAGPARASAGWDRGGRRAQRSIQIARAVKAGQRLQGHVLDRVTVVRPQAVTQDTVRSLLGQRPKAGPLEELSPQFVPPAVPGACVAMLRVEPR